MHTKIKIHIWDHYNIQTEQALENTMTTIITVLH